MQPSENLPYLAETSSQATSTRRVFPRRGLYCLIIVLLGAGMLAFPVCGIFVVFAHCFVNCDNLFVYGSILLFAGLTLGCLIGIILATIRLWQTRNRAAA